MHNDAPGCPLHRARATFAVLATLAAAALTYRIWKASDSGVLQALTSAATGALLIGAVATGWRTHARTLRDRAQAAEWDAAEARKEANIFSADEDKAMWDSIRAADRNDEDTCAFGNTVVPINKYRYPEAG